MYLGLLAASKDKYFALDKSRRVASLTSGLHRKGLKAIKMGGTSLVQFEALYSDLHFMVLGGESVTETQTERRPDGYGGRVRDCCVEEKTRRIGREARRGSRVRRRGPVQ